MLHLNIGFRILTPTLPDASVKNTTNHVLKKKDSHTLARSNRDLTENSDLCLIAAARESFLVTKIVDDYPIGVQATCMRLQVLLHVSIPFNSIITATITIYSTVQYSTH